MTVSELVRQAADAYVSTGHPLALEVRAPMLDSLDRMRPVPPSTVTALSQLGGALAAPDAHPIAKTIEAVTGRLQWCDVDAMQQLDATRDRHAYTEIVGPEGVFVSDIMRFGLYLQSAGTVYPDHHHAAVELYFVVSGTAEWRRGEETFAKKVPGSLIHHETMQPHATTTRAEPLVAMWVWIGDISADSYEVSGVSGL